MITVCIENQEKAMNLRLILQKTNNFACIWCSRFSVLLISEFCVSVITECCGCLLHVHMQLAERQKQNEDLIEEMDKVMTELEKTRPGKAKKMLSDAGDPLKV